MRMRVLDNHYHDAVEVRLQGWRPYFMLGTLGLGGLQGFEVAITLRQRIESVISFIK